MACHEKILSGRRTQPEQPVIRKAMSACVFDFFCTNLIGDFAKLLLKRIEICEFDCKTARLRDEKPPVDWLLRLRLCKRKRLHLTLHQVSTRRLTKSIGTENRLVLKQDCRFRPVALSASFMSVNRT